MNKEIAYNVMKPLVIIDNIFAESKSLLAALYLPVQVNPFPTNPCLHSQVPLMQFAFMSQRLHLSTISWKKK